MNTPEFGLLEFIDMSADLPGPVKIAAAYQVARESERIGFSRLWFGEHHGPGSPSSNPMIPIAVLSSELRSLRLGTAASLPRVREVGLFVEDVMSLGVPTGGRLDVGLGRGGVDSVGIKQFCVDGRNELRQLDDFDALDLRVADCVGLLRQACSEETVGSSIQLWIHGTSPSSAALANQLNVNYCHGLFLNGDIDVAIEACRTARTPTNRIGVAVQTYVQQSHSGPDPRTGFEVNARGTPKVVARAISRIIQTLDPQLVVLSDANSAATTRIAAFVAVRENLRAFGYWA